MMGALPKAMARRGHRTMAVVPRYSNYEEGWETGVRIRLRVMGSDTEVQCCDVSKATAPPLRRRCTTSVATIPLCQRCAPFLMLLFLRLHGWFQSGVWLIRWDVSFCREFAYSF